MIIVVFGLPGSGKSYFATYLAEKIGAVHIKSDQVRAELEKMGNYDMDTKRQVYEALIEKAEKPLKERKPVILDATFHQAQTREMVQEKAFELRENLYFMKLTAGEEVIYQRVSKNRPDSEADYAVYQKLKASFEPLDVSYLELDSGKEYMQSMLDKALNYLGMPNPQ